MILQTCHAHIEAKFKFAAGKILTLPTQSKHSPEKKINCKSCKGNSFACKNYRILQLINHEEVSPFWVSKNRQKTSSRSFSIRAEKRKRTSLLLCFKLVPFMFTKVCYSISTSFKFSLSLIRVLAKISGTATQYAHTHRRKTHTKKK